MPRTIERKDPYLSIQNLSEYVQRKMNGINAGLINGKVILDGKYYSLAEYEANFAPIELQYAERENPDGTRIK